MMGEPCILRQFNLVERKNTQMTAWTVMGGTVRRSKMAKTWNQSRKNPVSASAILTGMFLQIRKVFATSSLLAEEFTDTLQYKISR